MNIIIIKSNIHTHSNYSDGKNTPEEMIISALENGFETLGFSDHSYTVFDESYCMMKENYDAYRKEINGLKKKYDGKIELLCGTEFDYFSDRSLLDGFDYYIASVHYVYAGGKYYSVDHSIQTTLLGLNEGCGGNENEYVRRYFETVAKCVELSPVYICHFDLPCKYNVLNESSPYYRKTALEALDAVLDKNIPVEINTGAIARGLKKEPYPADFLLKRIGERGGAVVIGSDCHDKKKLTCGFNQSLKTAKNAGIENILEFLHGKLNIVKQ